MHGRSWREVHTTSVAMATSHSIFRWNISVTLRLSSANPTLWGLFLKARQVVYINIWRCQERNAIAFPWWQKSVQQILMMPPLCTNCLHHYGCSLLMTPMPAMEALVPFTSALEPSGCDDGMPGCIYWHLTLPQAGPSQPSSQESHCLTGQHW